MRIIAIGCEYSGVTTLLEGLNVWGAQCGVHFHMDDHFTIPDAYHLSNEEQQAMLDMLPTIKERFQRFQIVYHVRLINNYKDILLGGFHLEEEVYGPLYYYPGLTVSDTRKYESEMPDDAILVHLHARPDVIAQRLDEAEAALNVAVARVNETEAAIQSLSVEIDKAQLIAPFDGIVDERLFDEGTVVMAGSPVLGITSTDDYQARFAIPADLIDQFKVNESVLMRVGQYEVNGTVLQRLPTRNVQTRTIDILVTLNSNNRVRPGDMATLSGARNHTETGAWLPVNALSNGLRGLWRVFVLSDGKETEIEARVVEVVYTDGRNAFVRGALKNGDVYVNEGTHKLAPGQVVSLSSKKQPEVR